MNKLFTLLMLMACSIGAAWAVGETFTLKLNNGATQTRSDGGTGDFFTVNAGGGYNAKYTGTYNSVSYTKGLKVNSSSSIKFTTSATSKVIIVQSLTANDTKYVGFDGNKLGATDRVDNATDKVGVYTLTDVTAGEHTIAQGTGETGILFVSVEYTGSVMTTLSAPSIEYNATTGNVTITDPNSSSEGVYYTTDGSTPSVDNGTKYESPFTVEDGTDVKAVAIGNGTTTISSSVAEQLVLLEGITIETPVIKVYNGTVAITCSSANAKIEYSTNGTDYTAYSRAFTLLENATIYARASRDGCTTSEVATAKIVAFPANQKSKTILMGYGSFDLTNVDGLSTLVGKEADAANGYSLILNVSGKDWNSANNKITMANNETRTGIKGSNGAQVILRLPEGVKATRLTLYSYVNAATGTRTTGWREMNGGDLTLVVNDFPMGANSDKSDFLTNPDVRVFPLDNVEGDITFTNTGEQVCFVIALDVIEPTQSIAITDAKYATCVTKTNLDFAGTDVTAYTVSEIGATTITLAKAEKVVAGQAVIVSAAAGGTYEIPTTTEEVSAVTNEMEFSDADTEVTEANTYYVVANGANGVGFYPVNVNTTIAAGKGFVKVEANNAKGFMGFGFDGETTGISEVKTAVDKTVEIYNLNGQRVAAPAKGLYIMNGKKVIIK